MVPLNRSGLTQSPQMPKNNRPRYSRTILHQAQRFHGSQIAHSIVLGGSRYVFLSHSHENILVALLVCYIAFFAFSQGAVIWVYIGEVFPNRVRASGQSLGSFTHWVMAGIKGITLEDMQKRLGIA
ncbi:MAG TPA: MFS transporter [Candidatus Acidoferrum sp.]|nr:MFS transporter [Candidatus Acidoferrum sp.]